MTPVLEIDSLSHTFSNGTTGLRDVNLTIQAGEFVVIAGKNGSGKTTLLRHLNGLILPQEGEVRVAGVSVADDSVNARMKVGMVFQDADSQIIGETVSEDVAFGPENLRLSRDEITGRVDQALNDVDLYQLKDAIPHTLSGGEKRRLAVAGILAMHPAIIVFDEPFSNLDYPGIQRVLKQMVMLHEQGRTLIVTTHDLEKVIAHADRLVYMDAGTIAKTGPPEELIGESEQYGIRRPFANRLGMPVESWLS